MAAIDRYDKQVGGRGAVSGFVPTGAAETMAALARSSGQIADRLGREADHAAIAEGRAAADRQAMALAMPGVDFAFDGSSSLTRTPKAAPASAGDLKAYLVTKHGLTGVQASGILGNLTQESSLRASGASGDGGTAHGLAQWRDERFDNLRRFAAASGNVWTDPHTQLDFIMHELATSEDAAGRALKSATTVEDATAAFIGFERPAGWTADNPQAGHGWANRLAYAHDVAGTPAAQAVATTAGSVEAASAEPQGGEVAVRLTGMPVSTVPQMRGGTLYGDAFNEEAMRVAGARMQTALRSQMQALAIAHGDDPAALDEALDALHAGYRSGGQPPAIAVALEETFQNTKLGLMRGAAQDFEKKRQAEWQAASENEIASRTDNAIRLATRAGTDEKADAALAGELAGIDAAIGASGMSPVEQERKRRALHDDVYSARVLGGFQALDGPEARAAYVRKFQEDWAGGEGIGAEISADAYGSLNSDLVSALQRDQAEAEKQQKAIGKAIDGQMDFLKKGWPVSKAASETIRAEVDRLGDPALSDQYRFFANLSDWQRAHLTARPEVLAAQEERLRQKMTQQGASEGALITLDVIDSLRQNMEKGLATDPLTFADRAGLIDLAPIDFSSADTLTSSLTARAADAHAVSDHYGRPAKFFTGAEIDQLKKAAESNPLALPQFASSIVSAFGADAPAALSEISKDAPVIAHVAGLYQATGDQRLMIEAGEALARRHMDGYQAFLPPRSKLAQATGEALGGALAALPKTAIAAAETASLIFEERARRQGLSMDDFDSASSPARQLYAQALNETLGATVRDGVTYGGLAEVNGAMTIVPADMTAGQLDSIVASLSSADLATQGAIGSANGIPIRPADLRGGTLVYAGPGRYRVALGDPNSDNPRYVPAADGGYFTLDVEAIAKARRQSTGTVSSPIGNLGFRGVTLGDDGRPAGLAR